MASPTSPENPYAAPSVEVALRGELKDAGDETIDLAAVRPTNARYFVAAALCLAAAAVYVQRNSIGVAETSMREDLGLTLQQMGWVMSAFFFSYALLQVPSAAIVQWFGARASLTFFVALSSLASAAMAVSGGLFGLIGVRALMGLAQAGVFPAAAAAVGTWIPVQRRGIVNGTLAGFMSLGGAGGAFLTGLLLASTPWQTIFIAFALPGILWAVVFAWWYRNRPAEHPGVNAGELALIARGVKEFRADLPAHAEANGPDPEPARKPAPSGGFAWAVVALVMLCAQQTFRGAGYVFFASWFATYLRATHGVEDVAAGVMNGLPLAAVVVGSPLAGVLVDFVLTRTGSHRLSRQGVAIVASLICAGLVVLSMGVANVWLAVALISAGSFFASFGGPCAYCGAIDIGGRYTPISFGLMNMMGNLGSAAFPLITPWLLKQTWFASSSASSAASSAGGGTDNWRLVMFCFAGMYVATAICWLGADTKRRLDAH